MGNQVFSAIVAVLFFVGAVGSTYAKHSEPHPVHLSR